MGLFNLKKDSEQNSVQTSNVSNQTFTEVEYAPTNGLLNLTKGDILDLRKYSSSLEKVRVAAGWDVNQRFGSSYDLDVCAFMINKNGKAFDKVYYGAKKLRGIFLDGDNLTGEGDGDDENIFVNLKEIPDNVSSIIFAVVIYSAKSKGQSFGEVKNAYVRLVDEGSNGKEICKYSLSDDGGSDTAVTFAELTRNENGWSFKAIGNYSKDSIESLYSKLR